MFLLVAFHKKCISCDWKAQVKHTHTHTRFVMFSIIASSNTASVSLLSQKIVFHFLHLQGLITYKSPNTVSKFTVEKWVIEKIFVQHKQKVWNLLERTPHWQNRVELRAELTTSVPLRTVKPDMWHLNSCKCDSSSDVYWFWLWLSLLFFSVVWFTDTTVVWIRVFLAAYSLYQPTVKVY